MYNYNKLNKYIGFGVGFFACIIYVMTAEATVSFWDCGEYISAAAKVQNPHPPGNPFFVLIARFFVILFGDNPHTMAFSVNTLSAVSSGITIMFLFWITTYFAKQMALRKQNITDITKLQLGSILSIVFSGLIASLSLVFTDTFWFNAVEGEVYALAGFLLIFMFYIMIVWAGKPDTKETDRYLIFIALIIGMAVGIHLLDLLVIPALAMIFYFKKSKKHTVKGAIFAFLIGCGIVGVIMFLFLQFTLVIAAKMDMLFVNTFSLPLFTGFFTFFGILIVSAILYLRRAIRTGKHYLQLGLWCFLMIMLGYSTYNVSLIRSNADVSIDMNSPEDPLSFLNYILRLQYGDKPLLYGPVFTAGQNPDETGQEYDPQYVPDKTLYSKIKNEEGKWYYAESGQTQKIEYNTEDNILFPRIWQTNEDGRNSKTFYANWLGINKVQDPNTKREMFERKATFGDNIKWFLSYQFGWMYLRYFMWNFVGRQDDIQGLGDARDGNAITGIDGIDNMLLRGDQKKLPDSLKNHESHNTLFAIPFILGLIGLFYHYKRDKANFVVNFALFFFTGIAIVLYLNDTGPQPRERDYTHAISFLAFAVWIGLSFLPISEFIGRYIKKQTLALGVSFALLLTCPILLASQEWNDHDRSDKTLARDYAMAMLRNCPPNSILITFADNDTYPLWYIQEVEGYRKDVRIINSSLLGIDWYINQLRYKVNESNAIDLIFTDKQIFGNRNDYVLVNPKADNTKSDVANNYYDLYDIMKNFVAQDGDQFKFPLQNGDVVNYFPTQKFFISFDKQYLSKNKIIDTTYPIQDKIFFSIDKNVIYKSDLMVLALIASSANKRPIMFASDYKELGFSDYLQQNGMLYQLVPFNTSQQNKMNLKTSLDLSNNIDLGKFKTKRVYIDETNRQQLLSIREFYAQLAGSLVNEKRTAEAKKVLQKLETVLPGKNFPYAMTSRYNSHNRTSVFLMQVAYMAEYTEFADKIYEAVKKDLNQQAAFNNTVSKGDSNKEGYEEYYNSELLKSLEQIKTSFSKNPNIKATDSIVATVPNKKIIQRKK